MRENALKEVIAKNRGEKQEALFLEGERDKAAVVCALSAFETPGRLLETAEEIREKMAALPDAKARVAAIKAQYNLWGMWLDGNKTEAIECKPAALKAEALSSYKPVDTERQNDWIESLIAFVEGAEAKIIRGVQRAYQNAKQEQETDNHNKSQNSCVLPSAEQITKRTQEIIGSANCSVHRSTKHRDEDNPEDNPREKAKRKKRENHTEGTESTGGKGGKKKRKHKDGEEDNVRGKGKRKKPGDQTEGTELIRGTGAKKKSKRKDRAASHAPESVESPLADVPVQLHTAVVDNLLIEGHKKKGGKKPRQQPAVTADKNPIPGVIKVPDNRKKLGEAIKIKGITRIRMAGGQQGDEPMIGGSPVLEGANNMVDSEPLQAMPQEYSACPGSAVGKQQRVTNRKRLPSAPVMARRTGERVKTPKIIADAG